MSNGGAHTNFDGHGFGASAFGAASLLASAALAGVANLAAQRAAAWSEWTRDQCERALTLSEQLRARLVRRNRELETENARLRAVVATLRARR